MIDDHTVPSLKTPEAFPFPYPKPYDIQVQLMRTVFEAIESKKVAIVESPTGTGKSLSLLTATLTWLEENDKRLGQHAKESLEKQLLAENVDDPPWVIKHTLNRRLAELQASEDELKSRMLKARERERKIGRDARRNRGHTQKKARNIGPDDEKPDAQADDQFLPVDNAEGSGTSGSADGLSAEVRALMDQLEAGSKPKEEEAEEIDVPKIYYTSRTHTQLRQLTSELMKTTFARRARPEVSSAAPKLGIRFESEHEDDLPIRSVPLGGRKQLCINEKVREIGRKRGDERMNEACLDLQKADSKTGRCPYLPPKEREEVMLDFRDQILSSPKDIEDIVFDGKEQNVCPYYATRRSVKQAQLVTLPYNLLLQKSAREALGFSLKDHVVVIDEAHNLIDTLLSIHSVTLPLNHLKTAVVQISTYYQRFKNRLKSTHAVHLKQCLALIQGLISVSEDWQAASEPSKISRPREELLRVNDLLSKLKGGADQVNIVELVRYLKDSHLAQKISGYADKTATEAAQGGGKREMVHNNISAFHQVEAFLLTLTEANEDGRILLSNNPVVKDGINHSQITIRYILLNPAEHFGSVVQEARSVVLAGGTMAPMNDFMQLFPTKARTDVITLSCAHVIPKENLLTQVINLGPSRKEMEFKYDTRNDESLIVELGALLSSVMNLIPDGVVVFLPSYVILAKVKEVWQRKGLIDKLDARKKLFYEPQANGDVETVLRDYAAAIDSPEAGTKRKGALMLAVVGAKLSEGINFSDSLGRAVIMVGLPFASTGSVELKERMRYVTTLPGAGANAGQELYENLCMKAVNQSIGRAIRHQNDFACILLVDKRYSSAKISKKLPKWIGEDVKTGDFGAAVRGLAGFFKARRS